MILLPPSEGKASGRRGRSLDVDDLSFPDLNPRREAVLSALADASARDDALSVLGAPRGAAAQVAANTALLTAPTLRVSRLYTGVLYDALGFESLDAGAKRRAGRRLVVVSALFGALRFGDRVPAYRLSMDVDLPGVGKLAAAWREPLERVLPGAVGRGLVVDMRSSTYVAAWRPTGSLAERTVAVRVVRDSDGRRTAVSHMAKRTRGLVTRHLLETGADPRLPEELAEALASRFDVALGEPRRGHPLQLDVTEPSQG